MKRIMIGLLLGASTLLGSSMSGSASAQTGKIADFYRGKNVTMVVAFPAGGMYGLFARTIATPIGSHVPGKPRIVTEYMPGAGGMKAANYVFNAAPKNGTYIAMLSADVALDQVLRPKAVKYDARKFNFIGTIYPYAAVFAIWHTAGVKTWRDALTKTLTVASSGKSSHDYIEATLLRELVGMRLKSVTGYAGAADMDLAMERGEVDARLGGWMGLKAVKSKYLAEHKVEVILQSGLHRQHDLPHVPTMIEVAPTEEGKEMFRIMAMNSSVGWGLSMPPGVPADRVAAWRNAFDATVKDPAFLADAKKHGADVDSTSGAEVQAAVERTMSFDPALLAKMKKLIGF